MTSKPCTSGSPGTFPKVETRLTDRTWMILQLRVGMQKASQTPFRMWPMLPGGMKDEQRRRLMILIMVMAMQKTVQERVMMNGYKITMATTNCLKMMAYLNS